MGCIIDALCPCGVQVDVRDRDWLESHKMSALLTISRGSCEEPLMLEMGYCGAKPEDKPIVFVGMHFSVFCNMGQTI